YSHADYRAFGTFREHLRAVELALGIDFWCDDRTHAGYDWDGAIYSQINAAKMFVLLISAQFIASPYIWYKEVPAIRKRCELDKVLVVPVVLRPGSWEIVCDGRILAAPSDRGRLKPIANWRPQNDGFDRARQQIQHSVQSYFSLPPTIIKWL